MFILDFKKVCNNNEMFGNMSKINFKTIKYCLKYE